MKRRWIHALPSGVTAKTQAGVGVMRVTAESPVSVTIHPVAMTASSFGDRSHAQVQRPPFGRYSVPRTAPDALRKRQQALESLAAQAHGEALVQVLTAWEKRDAALLPASSSVVARRRRPVLLRRKALGAGASVKAEAAAQYLRLEMAAEVPTPAEHLDARRGLQLQLLTRRNDPAPAQTWAEEHVQGAFCRV